MPSFLKLCILNDRCSTESARARACVCTGVLQILQILDLSKSSQRLGYSSHLGFSSGFNLACTKNETETGSLSLLMRGITDPRLIGNVSETFCGVTRWFHTHARRKTAGKSKVSKIERATIDLILYTQLSTRQREKIKLKRARARANLYEHYSYYYLYSFMIVIVMIITYCRHDDE